VKTSGRGREGQEEERGEVEERLDERELNRYESGRARK